MNASSIYPDSDGRFMGDTDFHNHAMRDICEGLEDFFALRPIYVASNLASYPQPIPG